MNTPQINNGGPAFPRTKSTGYLGSSVTEIISVGGMSLRDYFAGQALAGGCGYAAENVVSADKLSAEAWKIADAMIAAREVKP